ncbi:MAG: glyoxalase/bleomycin resistance/extradiol dioxygenase family protein [Chitinophagales bacterium]
MIVQFNPYLTFNGNCREAMTFYKDCLGGTLHFQTIGDSPMADEIPFKFRDYILHATLTKNKWVLMGSDIVAESGRVVGNSVSLMVHCSSEEEIRTCYQKMSDACQCSHPLESTFWGALFGGLTDKFGNQWLFNCELNK